MSGERVLGDQGTKKDKGIPRNVPNLIRSPPPPRVWFPDTLLVPPSREPGDLIKAVASAHLLIAQSTPQLSRCVAQEGDMDEMEAAMHGRRLARSTQGDKAPPTGKTKGLTPREMCFEEKEYDCHPYERRRKKGILETAEASHSREGRLPPFLQRWFCARIGRVGETQEMGLGWANQQVPESLAFPQLKVVRETQREDQLPCGQGSAS